MRHARSSVVLALAGAITGCQSFIGVEDAQQHLPRLNGIYVVVLAHARPSNPSIVDEIRMQGTATLDVDNRSLSLAMSIVPFGGGTPLSETTLAGIEFPDDSDEVEYEIDVTIPAGAIDPATSPNPESDFRFNEDVRFIAEADYAFCAKPIVPTPPPEPRPTLPSLGSVMVQSLAAPIMEPDSDCDDAMRD